MSILSRLCRYVHTHGYSASVTESAVPTPRALGGPTPSTLRSACLEQMEPRVLLTTLTNNSTVAQTTSFFDFSKKNFTVTLVGNITVELYGSDGASLVNLVPAL